MQSQLKSLETLAQKKNEFAAMVSHELKTPLVPIKGYCKMLLELDVIGELNSAQIEAVSEIYENAKRLETLLQTLTS